MDFMLRFFWDFFMMAVVIVRLQIMLFALVRRRTRGTDSL